MNHITEKLMLRFSAFLRQEEKSENTIKNAPRLPFSSRGVLCSVIGDPAGYFVPIVPKKNATYQQIRLLPGWISTPVPGTAEGLL